MKKPVIGSVKLDGWAVLAPMAGVSDLASVSYTHLTLPTICSV